MKHVQDLKYPDVIHLETKEEHELFAKHIKLSSWEKKYKYYLVGSEGLGRTRADYIHCASSAIDENGKHMPYTIYEPEDIDLGNKFPEKWYIKSCKEVGNWLDRNSDMHEIYRLSVGYANADIEYLVYPSHSDSHLFNRPPNGYKEITFEQFKEHYLKQDNKPVMSKQKLTVSVTDVLEIHKIACSTWKEKIAGYLSRVDSDQNITFTQREIDKMFEAATGDQEPVLERIFGKKGPVTLKEMAGGRPLFKEDTSAPGKIGMIEVRKGGEYEGRAFYLNCDFNWELKTDHTDFYSTLILVPTPKN